MDVESLACNLSKRFSFYDSDFKVELLDLNSGKKIEITKSIYFEKLDKEFEWLFPKDFENELNQAEWVTWLKIIMLRVKSIQKRHLFINLKQDFIYM